MRLSALGPKYCSLASSTALAMLTSLMSTVSFAQTPPETLRVNVDPPTPGIRSITINKKYRAVISRDDEGVVIDTLGSDSSPPPCDVQLEVTLENSRILHRSANICSGGTLLVDVNSDGKPGEARVIGGVPTIATTPAKSASPQQEPAGETPASDQKPVLETLKSIPSGSEQETLLKPLERVDSPVDDPALSETSENEPGSSLPALVTKTLDRQGENTTLGTAQGEAVSVVPSEDRVWQADPGGITPGVVSRLQHGIPQTDDIDFRANCQPQSGSATIVFLQRSVATGEGIGEAVRLSAGDFSGTYNAIGSAPDAQSGQSFPQVTVPLTDPIWEALIRQSELSIGVEGTAPYKVSLKGSAGLVRLFTATCSAPQTIVEEGAFAQGDLQSNSDLSCRELGRVRSFEGVRPGQIIFRNTSSQPVEVNWIDYSGGERPYARLLPGQVLEQQTYVSHAWMVRNANGQCHGIYVTRSPYREVVVTGSRSQPRPTDSFDLPANSLPAGPIPPGSIDGGLQPVVRPQAGSGQIADYLCTAGVDLQVTFSPDRASATVAEMGYGVITLARQGGSSSFQYSGEGHELKGQIQNATWSRPGLRDVFCAMR